MALPVLTYMAISYEIHILSYKIRSHITFFVHYLSILCHWQTFLHNKKMYYLIYSMTLIIPGVYLFWTYLTKNHDYFVKRNIPFVRPYPIIGSLFPITILRKSLPSWLESLSQEFRPKK